MKNICTFYFSLKSIPIIWYKNFEELVSLKQKGEVTMHNQILLAEETIVELQRKEPERLSAMLDAYEIIVEIRRFDLDSSRHTCYLTIEMTKEEILSMAKRLIQKENDLNILDIKDCIWYKYFEEEHCLTTSIILKEPEMDNEQLTQAGKTFWGNHGGKIKTAGLLLLGMIVGAGVKTAMDRKAAAEQINTPA